MSVFPNLSPVALFPYVPNIVSVACKAAGLPPMVGDVATKASDVVLGFLKPRLVDSSQQMIGALQQATDRAWDALEIALAGDTFWNKCVALKEDRAFGQEGLQISQHLRAYLDQSSPFRGWTVKEEAFRQNCLEDLRASRKRGHLQQHMDADKLAQEIAAFARFSDPQQLLDREWKHLDQMAQELKGMKYESLAQLLEIRMGGRQSSLLVVGVRYFFRRAVDQNPELFHELALTKIEAIQADQQRGFVELAGIHELQQKGFSRLANVMMRLDNRLQRVDDMLVIVIADTDDIKKTVHSIEKQIHDLSERVPVLVRSEVLRQDSSSIVNTTDRNQVIRIVEQFYSLPEQQRTELPDMLNSLSKLLLAVGRPDLAHRDFKKVAELARSPTSKAEARYNAYLAALEHQEWTSALVEIRLAVEDDPTRFAPFPYDRYDPLEILGAGSSGVVYRCNDRKINRPVIIKAFRSGLNRKVDDVFTEAATLSDLKHPAIVRLLHSDYADSVKQSRPYLVVEYFDGMNLESYVEKVGKLTTSGLVAIAIPVAEALQVAHSKGIFHRAIKPENLLVRHGESGWEVKLIDFGLALQADELQGDGSTQLPDSRVTTTEKNAAQARSYAAPEQIGKLPNVTFGAYSDVYSFGRTCYYALLGTPEPNDTARASLSDPWQAFLDKCTGRTLRHRFKSFDEVLESIPRRGRKSS